MRKLFLVFLLLFTSSVAEAQNQKYAIFESITGGLFFNWHSSPVIKFAEKLGVPFDIYDPNFRTWGVAGVDDSVWFRQRYQAVICIFNDQGLITGTNWSSKFQKADGTTGVRFGPLGGRWGIPVFVQHSAMTTSGSYNDSTANNYVTGIVASGSAFAKEAAPSVQGTWRYRLFTKMADGDRDTIYCDPVAFACLVKPWPGPGSTAALIYADTTNGLGVCSVTDTVTCFWRYRPRDDLPGIYHSFFKINGTVGATGGIPILFNYMFSVTSMKPLYRVRIPFHIHDFKPSSLTDPNTSAFVTNTQSLIDNQIFARVGIHGDPCNFTTNVNSRSLEITRAYVNNSSGISKYNVFFNGGTCSGTLWHLAYYNATDTTGVRIRYNENLSYHANKDSLGLTRWCSSWMTASGGGDCGVWQIKPLADAGLKVFETIVPYSGSQWKLLPPVANDNLISSGLMAWQEPGGGNTRIIYTRRLTGLPENNTFTGLVGSNPAVEIIHNNFMQGLYNPIIYNHGLFIHMTNITGGGDPYYSWLFRKMGSYYKYFPKILEMDKDFDSPQIFNPRLSYTSRF